MSEEELERGLPIPEPMPPHTYQEPPPPIIEPEPLQTVGGIRLVGRDEEFPLEMPEYGAKFTYRRLPQDTRQEIVRRNTVRGKTNEEACAEASLRYCIRGWRGIKDARGEPIEWMEDRTPFLPEPIKARLVAHIFGTVGGEAPGSVDPL